MAKLRWNAPLDLENLAEEVADLARAEWRAVRSRTTRLIEHLLKLERAREHRSRRGLISPLRNADRELEERLTPGLRNELEAALAELCRGERKRTARKLALHGDRAAAEALPQECPCSSPQLRDEDWFPASRHGHVDKM